MKVDELLRLACLYAEKDRLAFVRAYSHMPNDPEAIKAEKFLKNLIAYRKKRWGQTSLELTFDEAVETQNLFHPH